VPQGPKPLGFDGRFVAGAAVPPHPLRSVASFRLVVPRKLPNSELVLRAALIGHWADLGFDVGGFHHDDCIPGTAVEKRTVGSLAGALLAPDAEQRIHLDAAEGRMILVGNPEHAVFDGAVFDTGGRAGATGAALGDNGKFFGFFLARGVNPLRAGLALHLIRHHAGGFAGGPWFGPAG